MQQYSSEDGLMVRGCGGLIPGRGLVEEHAGLVGAHTRKESWLGPQVSDVRFGCEVCLVLGPDHQRPFIS
jgi:hypothetical protein